MAQFKKQLHKEEKTSKEKISGRGATVKGKWPYYDINFWNITCSVGIRLAMFHRQQLQVFHSPIHKKLKSAILNWKEKTHVTTRIWKAGRIEEQLTGTKRKKIKQKLLMASRTGSSKKMDLKPY